VRPVAYPCLTRSADDCLPETSFRILYFESTLIRSPSKYKKLALLSGWSSPGRQSAQHHCFSSQHQSPSSSCEGSLTLRCLDCFQATTALVAPYGLFVDYLHNRCTSVATEAFWYFHQTYRTLEFIQIKRRRSEDWRSVL
jgi:hypothetical protein